MKSKISLPKRLVAFFQSSPIKTLFKILEKENQNTLNDCKTLIHQVLTESPDQLSGNARSLLEALENNLGKFNLLSKTNSFLAEDTPKQENTESEAQDLAKLIETVQITFRDKIIQKRILIKKQIKHSKLFLVEGNKQEIYYALYNIFSLLFESGKEELSLNLNFKEDAEFVHLSIQFKKFEGFDLFEKELSSILKDYQETEKINFNSKKFEISYLALLLKRNGIEVSVQEVAEKRKISLRFIKGHHQSKDIEADNDFSKSSHDRFPSMEKDELLKNQPITDGKPLLVIVDDDSITIDLAIFHLEKKYDVIAFQNANDVKQFLLTSPKPDLIILDITLPDESGYEVCSDIRKTFESNELPIILLTAHQNEESLKKGFDVGANDYITKPFSGYELEARVESHIHVAKLSESLSFAKMKLENQLSALKQTGKALREREEQYKSLSQRFQTLLNSIPSPILLLDKNLNIEWANNAAIEKSHFKHKKALGKCYQWWGKKEQECKKCQTRLAFELKKTVSEELITEDGKHYEIGSYPIYNENHEVTNVIEVIQDNTDKFNAQEERIRTGHLASLGELSAGIAHEVNNPINGIINCAEFLADKLEPNSKLSRYSNLIIEEGERIAGIVSNLLSFARGSKNEQKRNFYISEVLKDSLTLTEIQMNKENIRITVEKEVGKPKQLTGSPHQLQQVILNLFSNSRYALNKKFPGYDTRKELNVKILNDHENKQLRLSFRDNGVGISRDKIDKIMDPFYTTKPTGEGTGLGLSISFGIIHDHNGKITFESEEGAYTQVELTFPFAE